MMIMNQQKKKKSIRDQLFIVNKSAGRLRLILIVLLFLIYWSLVAQTEIAALAISENFLQLFPDPKNFTSGIIRDILLRYFSLSTILFTVTPLIIFLSTRKMLSRHLHLLFPSIRLEDSECYLNNCAFSSCMRDLHSHEEIHKKLRKNYEHLKFLGGPAIFTFNPSSSFIIQNIKNHDYLLITSDYQSITEKFLLSHGNKIYAVISKGDRKVLLKNLKIQTKNGQTFIIKLICLYFNFATYQKEYVAFSSRNITMHDARLLSYLGGDGKNIIHHFLYNETQDFLHKNASILFNDDSIPSSIKQVHEKFLNNAPKKLFRNYSEIESAITEKSRRVNRKHKHSRYIFLRKKSVFSFNAQNYEDNIKQLIIQLSNHLNEQLKSFFHISTIQISISEIGNFTING
jgi:hypothetical protein